MRIVMIVQIAIILLIVFGSTQFFVLKTQFFDESIDKIDNLAYTIYGNGKKTVIAIHGSPGSKDDFKDIAPKLQNVTFYAIDMPGFGESTMYAKNYGVHEASTVLTNFINENNLTNVTLLGYSWGGAVVVETANNIPHKINHVILLASMGIPEGEATGNYWTEKMRIYFSYPFVVWYPGSFVWDYEHRKGFMRSFMDTDLRQTVKQMQSMTTQVTLVHGENDTVVPMWVAKEHERLIPNAHMVQFPGGHGTIFRAPPEFIQVVQEAINEN